MELSRRRILQAGLLGLAGTAVGGAAAACSDDAPSGGGDSQDLSLWYWPGGLSGAVLADVPTQFPDLSFEANEIGGDFKDRLVTTITARQFLPDITGLKGEDIAYFMSQADQFLDLRDLGADDLKSQYLEWKWQQGATPDGKQIGFPIDIGPTGLYYRVDVYEQAGLPTEPADVAAAMSSWDDFFAAGVELRAAVPDAYMVVDASGVFGMAVGQGTQRYLDPAGAFIGDQDHIRAAWELAVRSVELGIDGATTSGGQDFNAAINNGTLPSVLGAAWLALDIKSAAEDTSGLWRVAPTPGGPANIGGSFLAIPASSGNPEQAFEIITWLLNADNQARGFTDSALFPSMPAAYEMDALTGPDEFFGGQATIEVFGPAAESIPVFYESEHDGALQEAYLTELTNIEASGKDPEAAWADAVAEAQRVAERLGVG